ncbi:glycosyltransferase [candidate division KSB3 bacterium]|uniref:Glycosyltransferase n=1 Tax=candidate division KSB3 bacterium TaxID=2044937 RepID=A0A9D5JSA9_9BACT|nr:glycosyltransferase [candidate division KSB3 bacterium]MBD3323343.1 glycosyltransferase [candidate division KSB3 bacterium]
MELSIISPMYNEEENIEKTVREIKHVLAAYEHPWELILVNDGSTDNTLAVARQIAQQEENVTVLSYHVNRGRGYALRTGFAQARGRVIMTIESDLSWKVEGILDMLRTLDEDETVDLVLASPYMPGGHTENVPFMRLAISRIGNKILGLAMPGNLHTVTQMFRAYRREVLDALELEADRKEIHLEILSKAMAAGFRAVEIPAASQWRASGTSSFKWRSTSISHLLFSFYEKPALLFGMIGISFAIVGVIIGVYIIVLWQQAELNPVRPLMTLLMLFVLSGIQLASFGFIGTQIAALRKEVIKVQRQNRQFAQTREPADQSPTADQ